MSGKLSLIVLAGALAACASQPVSEVAASAPRSFPLVAANGDLPAFFDCVRENDAMIISAHRGGPVPGYPENAVETFDHTFSEVPALLEIDVQKSADGAFVLMHDDTLDRTTTGEGEARNLTLAELKALRLVDNDGQETGFRIPTLDEALSWGDGRTIFALDRKGDTTYQDLVSEAERAGALNRVIFATYSLDDAAAVAALSPDAMIVVPLEKPEDLDALRAKGVDLNHVISWGGTEVPMPDFYAQLAAAGVETAFAPLGWWTGSWDSRIRMLRDDTLYLRITKGVQLVATDRSRELSAVAPGVPKVRACTR